jgi:hypothetical protein
MRFERDVDDRSREPAKDLTGFTGLDLDQQNLWQKKP